MNSEQQDTTVIALLADHPQLIPVIGEMRWKDWGKPPEPTELTWWIDVTKRESGREGFSITFVAINSAHEALGAVGLNLFDISERRDRSPWIIGTIVREDLRGRGIGRQLLNALELWATGCDTERIWVATGSAAVGFYQSCGYVVSETLEQELAGFTYVLTKPMARKVPSTI